MSEVTTLFREQYDIKTPTALVIGDPMYLEEIEDTTTDFDRIRLLKRLVLMKEKIPAISTKNDGILNTIHKINSEINTILI